MSQDRINAALEAGHTRRHMLKRSAQYGFAAVSTGAIASFLAACGSDDGSSGDGDLGPSTGTVAFYNYPGWIGKDTVSQFEQANSGVRIKEIAEDFSSSSGVAATVAQNPTAYDVVFCDNVGRGQLEAAGILAELVTSRLPNLDGVDQGLLDSFPRGVTSDFGKTGIAYRKDLVKEPVESWADFWTLVPRYSGKVVASGIDVNMIGNSLIYLGYDGNSTDEAELDEALDAMVEIKPDISAFKVTNVAQGLVDGSAVMTMGYDYETALVQQQNPNIEWVNPSEGAIAYLDGWVAINKSDVIGLSFDFMNYLIEPEPYAAMVNRLGVPYTVPAAKPYIKKSIADNPVLEPWSKSTYTKFLGSDGTKLRSEIWTQFQSA